MKSVFPIVLMTNAVITDASSSLRRELNTPLTLEEAKACNAEFPPLDFLFVEGDAVAEAIEDDIRADLEQLGFTVNAVKKLKDDFNKDSVDGNFHFAFSESYGNPYDPHSYADSWIDGSGGEGQHQAFTKFDGDASREELYDMIRAANQEEDSKLRQQKWYDIHSYYHKQAVMLPLWGKSIPTIINKRFTGYQAGHQQYDYPVHKLTPLTGSKTVTIAPGAQTGMFKSVGRLDPHTYRPNEFFANNWVYEGLTAFGSYGQTVGALARTWSTTPRTLTEGEIYTFQLREGVSFHDGEPWNCAAAKLNFDHIFAGGLVGSDWHGWHGVPKYIDTWTCTGDFEFTVTTKIKYSPFIQELTYIRPVRMLSPAAFLNGAGTDALTANSCHAGWGVVEDPAHPTVTCAGIKSVSGTGPLILGDRVPGTLTKDDGSTEEVDEQVTFLPNRNHWGGEINFDALIVKRYDTSEDIKNALINEELDMVWGAGVLPDSDVAAILDNDTYLEFLNVFQSDDIQNVIMLLNSGKAPLDDINVRKIVIHAINKAQIVQKELANLQTVVDNVFPRDSPNCNVDLTPRWDYDLEKAILLSCQNRPDPTQAPTPTPPTKAPKEVKVVEEAEADTSLQVGLGIGLGVVVAIFVAGFVYYQGKVSNLEAELNKKSDTAEVN